MEINVLHQIVNNNWNAIVYAVLDGTIQYTNKAAEELYGYTSNELIGKHVDVFNAQQTHNTQEIIEAIISKGGWTGEIIQKRKNGSTFKALLTVHLVYDENKSPIGYVSNSKDISAQIEREEKLKLSELHFRSLAENSPNGILKLNKDGLILYTNRESKDVKVIGSHVSNFLDEKFLAEYLDKLIKVFELKENQQLIINSNYTKKWYAVHLTPIFIDGEVKEAMAIFEDITLRIENEKQILLKEAQLEAIINNTSDLVLSIDRDYNILIFNSTFAQTVKIGFGVDLKKGDPVLNYISPSNHKVLKDIYSKTLLGEKTVLTNKFQTSQGDKYHETSYNPIYDNDGKVEGIAIFSRDITERILKEEKLKEALQEKEILLQEIHHRLKNNLSVISSIIQLQLINVDNEVASQILNESLSRIKATALVHELLYQTDSLSDLSLEQFVHELTDQLKAVYKKDKVTFNIKCEEIYLPVKHATACGLLLNEIITNSLKHSFKERSEGYVDMDFKKNNGHCVLNYKDNGSPIKKKIDFNNNNSTGLTLIKTFVDQLNGEIVVEDSENIKYKIELKIF